MLLSRWRQQAKSVNEEPTTPVSPATKPSSSQNRLLMSVTCDARRVCCRAPCSGQHRCTACWQAAWHHAGKQQHCCSTGPYEASFAACGSWEQQWQVCKGARGRGTENFGPTHHADGEPQLHEASLVLPKLRRVGQLRQRGAGAVPHCRALRRGHGVRKVCRIGAWDACIFALACTGSIVMVPGGHRGRVC